MGARARARARDRETRGAETRPNADDDRAMRKCGRWRQPSGRRRVFACHESRSGAKRARSAGARASTTTTGSRRRRRRQQQQQQQQRVGEGGVSKARQGDRGEEEEEEKKKQVARTLENTREHALDLDVAAAAAADHRPRAGRAAGVRFHRRLSIDVSTVGVSGAWQALGGGSAGRSTGGRFLGRVGGAHRRSRPLSVPGAYARRRTGRVHLSTVLGGVHAGDARARCPFRTRPGGAVEPLLHRPRPARETVPGGAVPAPGRTARSPGGHHPQPPRLHFLPLPPLHLSADRAWRGGVAAHPPARARTALHPQAGRHRPRAPERRQGAVVASARSDPGQALVCHRGSVGHSAATGPTCLTAHVRLFDPLPPSVSHRERLFSRLGAGGGGGGGGGGPHQNVILFFHGRVAVGPSVQRGGSGAGVPVGLVGRAGGGGGRMGLRGTAGQGGTVIGCADGGWRGGGRRAQRRRGGVRSGATTPAGATAGAGALVATALPAAGARATGGAGGRALRQRV
eukprot:ctg_193.g94